MRAARVFAVLSVTLAFAACSSSGKPASGQGITSGRDDTL